VAGPVVGPGGGARQELPAQPARSKQVRRQSRQESSHMAVMFLIGAMLFLLVVVLVLVFAVSFG
jgi:heme/copper-type cytochrome/quinol oxidase subunit 2